MRQAAGSNCCNMAEQRPESTAIGMNIPWLAHHFSQTVQLIKCAHNCGFNNIIDRGNLIHKLQIASVNSQWCMQALLMMACKLQFAFYMWLLKI